MGRRWCSGRRARPLCVPVGGGPPASRPRCELRSARRLEARPGPAAAHRHRGRSLRCPSHLWGLVADVCLSFAPRSPARPRHRPSISHVIPLRLVQTLNLYRRNCNVFGVSRKMTAINYVRNVGGGGVVAAHGCRSQVLPLLVGVTGAWCAWFFGVLWCVLLQTSSIQGVFRVDFCPVVTNVVNSTAFSLIMVVFGLRLTTFVTGALVRRFESCWFDDVCNVGRPLAARPGSAAAHGRCGQALSARPPGCLKPPSPLRVRNGLFWCSFRVQR